MLRVLVMHSTIGTALYVQIGALSSLQRDIWSSLTRRTGHGLVQGGPGSLFIAFTFW